MKPLRQIALQEASSYDVYDTHHKKVIATHSGHGFSPSKDAYRHAHQLNSQEWDKSKTQGRYTVMKTGYTNMRRASDMIDANGKIRKTPKPANQKNTKTSPPNTENQKNNQKKSLLHTLAKVAVSGYVIKKALKGIF